MNFIANFCILIGYKVNRNKNNKNNIFFIAYLQMLTLLRKYNYNYKLTIIINFICLVLNQKPT